MEVATGVSSWKESSFLAAFQQDMLRFEVYPNQLAEVTFQL